MLSTSLAAGFGPSVIAGTPGPGKSKMSASTRIFSFGRYAMTLPSVCGVSLVRCTSIQEHSQNNKSGTAFVMLSRLSLSALVAVFVFPALSFGQQCKQKTPDPVVNVNLPGHPFFAMESLDGCWIFVRHKAGLLLLVDRTRTGGEVE